MRLLFFLLLLFPQVAEARVTFNPFTSKQDFTGVSASTDLTIPCDDDAILKYDTGTATWSCASDATGAGANISVLEDGTLGSSSIASLDIGTALDTTIAGSTARISWDSTEVGTTTWGSGSTSVWTFNTGTNDPAINLNDGSINVRSAPAAVDAFVVSDAGTDHLLVVKTGSSGLGAGSVLAINDSQLDYDVRMESNNFDNAFRLDAGLDSVLFFGSTDLGSSVGMTANASTDITLVTKAFNAFQSGNLLEAHSADATVVSSISPAGNVSMLGDLTVTGGDITLGTTSIFSGGDTASLNNIDAINATTETTFEAAIDIAGDVTGTGLGSVVVADNAVDGTDIALGSDAAGDVIYYNGTDYVRLPIGTAGQVLEVNAGATAPEWDTDDSGGAADVGWTDGGTLVRVTTSTDNVLVGGANLDYGAQLQSVGTADEIQLLVRGNGTQTSSLVTFENSSSTDVFTVSNTGVVVAGASAGSGQSTTESGWIINNAGTGNAVDDFQVKGDNDANTFYVKASSDRVGVGVSTPTAKLSVSGDINTSGTFLSSRATDLGWSVSNAANQACNTTCLNACVFGIDTAAIGNLLACTDATSDSCLCAGAN